MTTTRRIARLSGRTTLLAALIGGALAGTASGATTTSLSTNWSGYVVRPSSRLGTSFHRVAGSWTEPTASCPTGHTSYSAVWVGLGGYSADAGALEQIGTDADCSHTGTPHYSAWFELLPAAPIDLAVVIRPGDHLTASVTVSSDRATLRLADLTSGKRFSTTRRLSSIDVSTAEWIVEAPSECNGEGSCETLPLADFGEVQFSSATATAAGHMGKIDDSAWLSTKLLLRQSGSSNDGAGARAPSDFALVAATPSSSAGTYGAFSVGWSEQAASTETPSGPTLPGFSGGAP